VKLSEYAKQAGVSYRTAWRWWKSGALDGYQLPTGTIIITSDKPKKSDVACIYARVSHTQNKDSLDRQAQKLTDYAIAKGYQVYKVVKEIGSGVDDNRQKLVEILTDPNYTVLVVEHPASLTRFGANYINLLFKELGKRIEVVNAAYDDKTDLMDDFVETVASFCSHLYGLKITKRKTERLIQELTKDRVTLRETLE
jgi:predicted site-specific integrase-resolvase